MTDVPLLKVFVYGTLKPGGLYWYRFCEGKVLGTQPAKVRGQLYQLEAGYPALLPGWEGEGANAAREVWAHGFVLTLADPDALEGLDQLEGYQEGRAPGHNEYQRVRTEVRLLPEDSPCEAWIYIMSATSIRQQGGHLIEDGDWQG